MNESELPPPTPVDLAGQLAALQRQMTTLLMALIVISGTLGAYLFYQSHVLGKEVENTAQVIQSFSKNRPMMEKFVQQLVAYGQTHPDFQPVLLKYGIIPPPGAPKK